MRLMAADGRKIALSDLTSSRLTSSASSFDAGPDNH